MMNRSNRLLNLLSEVMHSNLKNQIEYLRVENIILRKRCLHKRLILTDEDRSKLLKYGIPLGPGIKHLLSIVHYTTFRKWVNQMNRPKKPQNNRGRPRVITDQIRLLVVEIARKNKWGCLKILAELRKLSIKRIGKTSVRNILKEYGVEPFKVRCENTWDQYLKRTFDTLWACDFFSKYVWTPFGRRLYHVLFFINVKTRQVHIAGITKTVTKQWLMENTEKLSNVFDHDTSKAALVRDREVRFAWVATIKRECLNHFLVVGHMHLEYLIWSKSF